MNRYSSKAAFLLLFASTTSVCGQQVEHRHTIQGGVRFASALAFSPDGKLLYTASYGALKIWDTASNRCLASLPAIDGSLMPLPDGEKLATFEDVAGAVYIREARTGKVLDAFSTLEWGRGPAAFSRDGKLFAVRETQYAPLSIVDVATKKRISSCKVELWNSHLLAFSPDGRTLCAGGDSLWDVKTGKLLRRFERQGKPQILGLAFSPDGSTLALSTPKEVELWHVAEAKQQATFAFPYGERESAAHRQQLAFSPNGKLLAGPLAIWDVKSGKVVTKFPRPEDCRLDYWSCCFSPDSGTLAVVPAFRGTNGEETLFLWDVANEKKCQLPAACHVAPIDYLTFSSDSKSLVSVATDERTARRWDVRTGKQTAVARRADPKDRPPTYPIAVSPDGKTLVSAAKGELYPLLAQGHWKPTDLVFWDLETGKTSALWSAVAEPNSWNYDLTLPRVTFSADGKTVLFQGATREGSSKFEQWDVASGKKIRAVSGEGNNLRGAMLSPDGTRVAELRDTIAVFELPSRASLGKYVPKQGAQWADVLAFSPLDQRVALVQITDYGQSGPGKSEILLWEPRTNKAEVAYDVGRESLSSLAWSPDGQLLASGASSVRFHAPLAIRVRSEQPFAVRVWNLASGKEILAAPGHTSAVTVVFSPDGRWLASADRHGTIQIWEIVQNKGPKQ